MTMLSTWSRRRGLALVLLLAGCSGANAEQGAARTLTFAAYTTPREAYGREILPAFISAWADSSGHTLRIEESYLGSGAQARAIAGGFEADIAALSLEPDIQTLVDAGLVRPDWNATPFGGMVTRSIVVIAVRPGNPKRITDWKDLTRADVEVVTPNPRTSGGAMWNIAALYGAALRERGGTSAADSGAADALLRGVLSRVRIMDKGAREAMLTFEHGVGDAAITYENEVLVAQKGGQAMDYVIPSSTILIENPVAIVHGYAEPRGTVAAAEAFVRYLTTPDAQRMFTRYGLRAVDSTVAGETQGQFPSVRDLFTIRDLGGWPAVVAALFAPGGAFDRASAAAVAGRR